MELIEERERAIRQLEVFEKENMHAPFVHPSFYCYLQGIKYVLKVCAPQESYL